MCHPPWVAPRSLVRITVTGGDCTLVVPFQHQQPYSHPSRPHISVAHWGFKTLSINPIAVSVCCLIANWLSLKYGLFPFRHGCAHTNHSVRSSCPFKADGKETVADLWMAYIQHISTLFSEETLAPFAPENQGLCWNSGNSPNVSFKWSALGAADGYKMSLMSLKWPSLKVGGRNCGPLLGSCPGPGGPWHRRLSISRWERELTRVQSKPDVTHSGKLDG